MRPGGTETVGIAGLSEGSADQLYLALRLASLETYLESHEPIPLVVDDILIQFDDDRRHGRASRPLPNCLTAPRSSSSHTTNMFVGWRKPVSMPIVSSFTDCRGEARVLLS